MNRKLIFSLSLFGLAMAFGTVYVLASNVEPIFWAAIFLVCALCCRPSQRSGDDGFNAAPNSSPGDDADCWER